jgi:hypothetical protein
VDASSPSRASMRTCTVTMSAVIALTGLSIYGVDLDHRSDRLAIALV